MSILKRKSKAREEQALRLKQSVGSRLNSRGEPERVLVHGRGVLEELDPTGGAHVTDSVFVLTDESFYFEFLEETPKEIKSSKGRAIGFSAADSTQLAKESTIRIAFSDLRATAAKRAVDGRWDLLLVPKDATSEADFRGFGVIQCYGGTLQPEDVAHRVRLMNRTVIDEKLERGQVITMAELTEVYGEVEHTGGAPPPESLEIIALKASEADRLGLLRSDDDDDAPPSATTPPTSDQERRADELLRATEPEGLREAMSATNLEDVPESVRIGSPFDAPDDAVWQAARFGLVHPQTNHAVVYRVAFAPHIRADEEPITLRVMFATSRAESSGPPQQPTTEEAAWLLVTNRGLRWHFMRDGVPAVGLNPDVPRPEGPRAAGYASLTPADLVFRREVVSEFAVPLGDSAIDFFGFRHETSRGPWVHAFGLPPGSETDMLMREINERIAEAKA